MMRLTVRVSVLALAMLVCTLPAAAQGRDGVMGELAADLGQVEKKLMGLAKAMPQAAWDWRPAEGVRTTGEVFLHIAADNYFLPAMVGRTAPAETGITKDYPTVAAFEKKSMSRDAVLAELEKSFAFLRTSMAATTDAQLGEPLQFFGQKTTHRGMWIATVAHLHEHLGQLIAYARSNKITPPWSK